MTRFFLVSAVLLVLLRPSDAATSVVLLEVQGAIGPATGDFILRGLENAHRDGAGLVILQMDTPGGLDSSMRDIIQAILKSPVPVATYVAPGGARAASAGTYILYASHIAAMAPATNLGAATPVQIGGFPSPASPKDEDKDNDEENGKENTEKPKDELDGTEEPEPSATSADSGQSETPEPESPSKKSASKKPQGATTPKTAMERKIINDARAYIRSLAQLRGRNVEWAEAAVTDAASLSAEEAQARGVIDFVAIDVTDLLKKAHGRVLRAGAQEITLDTEGAIVETVTPDWRTRLLAVITNPQVAYVLMLIGIYGLFFELSNPGAILPGVLGGICLLLALFAFQVLPINYAGLALILLGLMFMIGEAFMPSFGALGLGGIVAFVVGSLILWDEQGPGFEIPVGLIAGFAFASAVALIGLGTLAIRQRHRPVVTGEDALLRATGEVQADFQGEGWIRILSESWRAQSDSPLHRGQQVRITGRDGLVLAVTPIETEKEKK